MSNRIPHILHLVTWYPTAANHVDGIFTRRHIDLLAADSTMLHTVVRKTEEEVPVLTYLKCLLGFFPSEVYEGRKILLFPTRSKLFQKFFWRYKRKFEQRLLHVLKRKLQPSLLHLHVVYGFAEEAVFLHRQYGLPIVVSEHMAPFPFEWLWDKQVQVLAPMQAASAVVAVSEAQAEQIKAVTGVVPEVIANVIDTSAFRYAAAEKTNTGPNLVLVGIYESRKGADYLVEAFGPYLQQFPHATLHFVGTATRERMKELNEQISLSGIAAHVVFHGKLSPGSLAALYRQCDFYVCASEWESFGVSVLEALFTGLPVLSTDCGGVRSFMHEENGVLISNDRKPGSLLNGMLTITAMLPQFDREKIAFDAAERFAPRRIQQAYYTIYKRVLTAR